MNKDIVMIADLYDCIDGKNTCNSSIKQLTLGTSALERNGKRKLEISTELPVHTKTIYDIYRLHPLYTLLTECCFLFDWAKSMICSKHSGGNYFGLH